MNRVTRIGLSIVVLLVVAAGSFYGGMVYGQGRAQSSRQSAGRFAGGANGGAPGGNFQGGQAQGQGQGQRGGGLFGQVSEIGNGTMTVTDNNGKQTLVKVTDTTLIEKNASVKLTDLATGDTVMVSGTQGSDGTYTARSVQVAPAGRMGGPSGGTTTP